MTLTRRRLFQAGAVTLLPAAPRAAARARTTNGKNVYTRIGVRPFINLTATYTINGGALTLPEVKQAMEEASHYPANLDELMDKVGERLASLLGSEFGIVTSGCAAALAVATAACVAGADPEKMARLPKLDRMKDQVIMPKTSRNVYDHAIRAVGVQIVEVSTTEQFHNALGPRTAMVAVLGVSDTKAPVRLEQIVDATRRAGVPVLVDAAAELPILPNPYVSRGADLVAYSGGKFLRGPQCAGLLIGRKDLVRAAWLNSSPHHGFGRALKAGKEEIMGMLAAIEVWRNKYDLQAEYRKWEGWYAHIAEVVGQVPGVRTRVMPPEGASPYPVLELAWDPQRIGYVAEDVGRLLLDGEPRIMSHAEGQGHSFRIRPVAMKAGEYKLAAQRLLEVFRAAPGQRAPRELRAPAANVTGEWEVRIDFVSGTATHRVSLTTQGNRITGTHNAAIGHADLTGTADGNRVRLTSRVPYEGTRLEYEFDGAIAEDRMSGTVSLGEYGTARWEAKRV